MEILCHGSYNLFLEHFTGTAEERGLRKWRDLDTSSSEKASGVDVYSIDFIQKYIDKIAIFKYIPFCPSFRLSENKPSDIHDHKTKRASQCFNLDTGMAENTYL